MHATSLPAKAQIVPLHIAIAVDCKFIVPFYVLLTSLFAHHKDGSIELHIMQHGLSAKDINQIIQYAGACHAPVHFYTPPNTTSLNHYLVPELHKDLYSHVIFYRLYFAQLLPPGIKRVLYLDADCVAIKNLTELNSIQMNGLPVAAAPDIYVLSHRVNAADKAGKSLAGSYFNSGVLLIDVEAWKERQVTEKTLRYLEQHYQTLQYPDQDALNAVLTSQWLPLNIKYNFTYDAIPRHTMVARILNEVAIIHYNSQNKPWKALSANKLRGAYHRYLSQTPVISHKKYVDMKFTPLFLLQFFKVRITERLFELPVTAVLLNQLRPLYKRWF